MAEEPKVPAGWVDRAWDGSAAQWDDAAAYCSACLIDLNPEGAEKTKALCMLPYKEPSGEINVRGVLADAGGRGISRVTKPAEVSEAEWSSAKKKAAKKLIGLYEKMGRTAPEMVFRMAGEKAP